MPSATFDARRHHLAEGRGSRTRVYLNGVRAVFHRPHPRKETDKGALRSVGRFLVNVGVAPDLHRRIYPEARREGKSLNQWITDRLERAG